MQTKDYNIEVKDIDLSKNSLAGYFAEFATIDSYGEVTQKGAFAKTIRENGPAGTNLIRWCMNHDMKSPLGSFNDLREDDYGLFYHGNLGDMFWAKELRHMIDCGIKITHSYGYQVIKQEKKSDAVYLTEVKMFEGSCLSTWAANPNTPLVLVLDTGKSIKDNVKQFEAAIAPYMMYKSISEAPDEYIKAVEDWVSEQESNFYSQLDVKKQDYSNELIQIELLKLKF